MLNNLFLFSCRSVRRVVCHLAWEKQICVLSHLNGCHIWMLYSNTELIGLLFDVYIYEYFNTSNNTHLTEAYYFVSQR